jgi:valyl-tRNA synthetase
MDAERRKRLEATTRYDPSEVEDRILERWLEGGYFHPPAQGTPEENFSVAIPPPNVTGALHMGHALNGSIQDALVRTRRMQGRNTLWVLGTDHAGIATQAVVEKELRAEGTSRHELGREAFVERVWAWKEKYGSQIVEQYKRLGASCDYQRERFTLDERYVRAVYRVFVRLHAKGYIYRDNYIVNWDVGSRSAISDLEVENREVEDTLYEIDYPVEGAEGVLTVATVRPETMLADTAVAVHPADERYRDLVGEHCVLPLVGRRLPIIGDERVDREFGTGALKITPGHDPHDFEIGRAHGLDEVVVIGEDGRFTVAAGERFAGLTASEAQAAVVAALREEGSLRVERPYVHSVPYSHRSGERIEPLISLQWFCRMDELAAPAIQAVEREEVRIVPEQWRRVYLDWMGDIRPWCISRQLWWGHRLPVWYGPNDEIFVAEHESEAQEAATAAGIAPEGLRQEEDVLDTWFSSAIWPFATLGWPDEEAPLLRAFYPTDFLTTAREIIFLWVARMIMTGLEFAGDIPFEDVYVHSVIQAPDGRRMSKSLGTGIDPLDEIDVHGADALRFGLLAMSSSQDVRYSAAKVQQGRDLANKMWNASRLILLNVNTAPGRGPAWAREPASEAHAPVGERTRSGPARVEDRWILSRLQRAIETVSANLDSYDFAHAALELYRFFWSELCDWYLEIVKPRLYDGEPEAAETLLGVLEQTLALAHPAMPFVTEEIYAYLRAVAGERGPEMLVVHPFPGSDPGLVDEQAERELEASIDLTRRVRRWRDLVGVAAGSVLPARLAPGDEPHELVARLARLSYDGAGGEPLAAFGSLEILASGEVDSEQVRRRVKDRRERLVSEIQRAESRLANQGFVQNAPPDVVEEERGKLAAYRAELEELGGS